MPQKNMRGTITGMVWLLLMIGIAAPGGARAQGSESQTLQVEVDEELRGLLADAEDLLADNRPDAAYERLTAHESRYAGNPLFDYLLGVAALDSGNASEAIFSLQRALAVAPGFSGARLELARAWYDTGQHEMARPLFERVLEEEPPAPVRAVVVRYLVAIDAAPPRPRARFQPYAELFAGHDSNANGSTADEQFMGFLLNPANVETSSPFIEAGAGFRWWLPASQQFGWQAGLHASHRRNPDAPFVDATIVSGNGGFSWRRGAYFGRAAIDAYFGARDGEANESFTGLDTAIGRRFNNNWSVSLGLRGGAQRFDDAIDVLDVNRLMFSLTLTRRYASGVQFDVAGIGGGDNEREAGSPYGNSKVGARAGLYVPLNHASRLQASVGLLQSDYDGLFFGESREDRQLTGALSLEFRDVFLKGLSISPRVRYVNNDSDVALYDYGRTEFGIGLRWTRQ